MITEATGRCYRPYSLPLALYADVDCGRVAIEMMEKRRRTGHFYCLGSGWMMVWMDWRKESGEGRGGKE